MKKLNKTLLILLCAGSISMAGCGNSAAVSKDSTAAKDSAAAIETVDEEKVGTAAPETAGSGEAGDSETAIADASDASESYIYRRGGYVLLPGSKDYDAKGNCGRSNR